MDSGKWISRYSVDCSMKYPSKKTQKNYISSVKLFLKHFESEEQPKCISNDKIKEWLLLDSCENTRNQKLCAIKSFYKITVGMPVKLDKIPFSRKAQKLPMPLSLPEVKSLFYNCTNSKHKAIISLLFGCGMRVVITIIIYYFVYLCCNQHLYQYGIMERNQKL